MLVTEIALPLAWMPLAVRLTSPPRPPLLLEPNALPPQVLTKAELGKYNPKPKAA
jgi:hypothetical protein